MEAGPGLSVMDVDMRVKARMKRQTLLVRGDRSPQLDVLIGEDVLDQPVPPDLMRDQLARLLEASELPQLTLRVVPRSVWILGIQVRSFAILEFPQDNWGEMGESTTVQTEWDYTAVLHQAVRSGEVRPHIRTVAQEVV